MLPVASRHGPGCVGVIYAGDIARFHHLTISLDALHVPHGTKYLYATGCNPAKSSNNLVKSFLSMEQMQWLWIMGDDHCFEEDCLLRLLDRDKDCILPLTPRRNFPHDSVVWKEFVPEEQINSWYTWEEIERFTEPFPVAAAGTAGLLVKRRVFERMREPWFTVGNFGRDELQEDVAFTWKANKMGHTVFCDPTVPLGHITTAVLFPKRDESGKFGIAANIFGHKMFVVPPGFTAKRDENGDSVYRRPVLKAVA